MDSKVIKPIKRLVCAINAAIIVMFCGVIQAQQDLYLLDPSRADLIQMAQASSEIYAPMALPFVFKKNTAEYYMGTPISNKIRNGVHGRLLVENGILDTLNDASKSKHGYEAGTIFLELDEKGEPFLSIHLRNSFISTINEEKVHYNFNFKAWREGSTVISLLRRGLVQPVPSQFAGFSELSTKLLQQISNDFQMPIKKSSKEFFDRVNTITANKYSIQHVVSYFKFVNTQKLFRSPIIPNTDHGVAESRSSSPEVVAAIIENRAKMPAHRELGIKIHPTPYQKMCKAIFRY